MDIPQLKVELNGMWAVTDFTESDGATRIVPGSHKLGNREELQDQDTIPAEMSKESLLLYTGALYHGGGANKSTEWRAACRKRPCFVERSNRFWPSCICLTRYV